MHAVYEGQWRQDHKHGTGRYDHDGALYEGEWRQDEKRGHGVEHGADGSRYEGQFRHDGRHGLGMYTAGSGAQYDGQFKDDKIDGRGCFRYADGRVYTGEWSVGRMHGHGVMELPDGSRFEGQFVKGLLAEAAKREALGRGLHEAAMEDAGLAELPPSVDGRRCRLVYVVDIAATEPAAAEPAAAAHSEPEPGGAGDYPSNWREILYEGQQMEVYSVSTGAWLPCKIVEVTENTAKLRYRSKAHFTEKLVNKSSESFRPIST